jgi:c-di-GMP-binding flagellar brake protein YcgR
MVANRAAASIIESRGARQRRRHPRVSVCARLRLVAQDDNMRVAHLRGHILDLSAGGCAARVHAHLEPGLALRLELEIDGESMWIPGRVMWSRTRDGAWMVGVRFEHIAPEHQAVLLRYVNQQQSRRLY